MNRVYLRNNETRSTVDPEDMIDVYDKFKVKCQIKSNMVLLSRLMVDGYDHTFKKADQPSREYIIQFKGMNIGQLQQQMEICAQKLYLE